MFRPNQSGANRQRPNTTLAPRFGGRTALAIAAVATRKFPAQVSRFAIIGLCWSIASAAQAQTEGGLFGGSPFVAPQSTNSNTSASQAQNSNGDTSDRQGRNDNPYLEQHILQPYAVSNTSNDMLTLQQLLAANNERAPEGTLVRQPPKPGEFENYMERLLGRKLPRYGSQLILPSARDFAAPATATVPPDYVVQPGDTIVISLTGSIDGSVEREVDTNGKIFLAGVGAVRVAGVRHSDLRDVIAGAIGTKFRGFTVSVTIKQLRGIRVYVTGLANNPGAFTINGLSTMANAVFQAGGPSAGGSWRAIKLYRGGKQIADFDLYQLMRGGHSVDDIQLQNEDVLFIPPAGDQVAVIGSVQEEAIYEAKPGESVADLVADAGGPNTLADRSRVILYRTGEQEIAGPKLLPSALASGTPVKGGDVVQILSTGTLTMPTDRQSVLVRVEGEVNHPGIYYVPPNTPMGAILNQAGGLTNSAYPFGTKFTRQSVKIEQQESYRDAIRQLELSLAAAPLNANSSISEAERNSQVASARAVLERLRQAEPDGRVVLPLSPAARSISGSILMENNDAIYVPPMPTTVGVFGAVYRPASFLVGNGNPAQKVRDYIEMSGGTLRAADRHSIFLVRANGEVVSYKRGALDKQVIPGDIIFVPVRTQANPFWARFKDITQTIFALGISAATVVAVTK